MEEYLKKIYYNPSSPASFSSYEKLWFHVKKSKDRPKNLTKKKVKEWVQMQDPHTVFKLGRNRFSRERIIVSQRDMQWDADLADMSAVKTENDGYGFILVVIDLLSRFCWLRPLKSKHANQIKSAFSDIFDKGKRVPKRLRTDKGGEFKNKLFINFMKEKNIHFFTTVSDTKANYAERLIRTIKNKIYKMMYDRQSFRYIDDLQDIASSYNKTVHSSIKMAPADVTEENDIEIYMKFYMPHVNKLAGKQPKYSFDVGDLVRVSHDKGKFSKSYFEQNTEEIFQIRLRILSFPPRYLISDLLGEKIDGSFYEQQLVKVSADENREYKIEKVIKFITRKKKRYAFVKWYGYPEQFNSYISAGEVKKYKSGSEK